MFGVIRKEDRNDLTHLCRIRGDRRQNTHKLPEVEPEGVIGYRVCMQVMVVLYTNSSQVRSIRHISLNALSFRLCLRLISRLNLSETT
jgi:hypothetical protein